MTDAPVSALRRRMIEDMTSRRLAPKTQEAYIRAVKNFTAFFGRSPDQAGAEDVRRYHLHLASTGITTPKLNAAVSAAVLLRAEPISPLIKETLELLLVATRTEGIRIKAPDELPDINVLADKIQIQQVLLNLMRNAVEAVADRERKEVALFIEAHGDTVLISVADNGPGLADEVKDRLFQPFVSTKKTGMGIGLSICRTIITAHNGRLWAEPNPAGGTIFRVTLRADQPSRSPA
jgi:C4-dicarboxylate-specific signal transduction histidine kinase